MRRTAVIALVLAVGCATPPSLVRVDPFRDDGQEVLYRDGTPIVVSRATRSAVSISPSGGPTGRYVLDDRITLLVAIQNRGTRRFEVSEANVAVTANGKEIQLVSAEEVEEAVLADAASARNRSALAAMIGSLGAAMQSDSGTALAAQRQVSHDAAARAVAIDAVEHAGLAGVSGLLQRNTVDPGAVVTGAVIFTFARTKVCPGRASVSANWPWPGACQLVATVTVDGESHMFRFKEAF